MPRCEKERKPVSSRGKKDFHAAALLLGKLNEIVPGRARGRRGQGAEDSFRGDEFETDEGGRRPALNSKGRTHTGRLGEMGATAMPGGGTPHQAKAHKGGPPRGRGARKFSLTPSQTTQQKVESRCSIVCFLIPATYTPTWQRGCSFFRASHGHPTSR